MNVVKIMIVWIYVLNLFSLGQKNPNTSEEVKYLRVHSFKMEKFGSSIIDKKKLGLSEKEGEFKIGQETTVEEGLIKWIKDDIDCTVLEIEFIRGEHDFYSTDPPSEWVRKDRECIKVPYRVRATLYRDGREVPLVIEIVEGVCEDAIRGSQHKRALYVLHDLMLTVLKSDPFSDIRQKDVLRISYPEKVHYEGIGTVHYKQQVYYDYPEELAIAYVTDGEKVNQLILTSCMATTSDGLNGLFASSYIYNVKQGCVVQTSQMYFNSLESLARLSHKEALTVLNDEYAEGTREFRRITLKPK